MNFIYLPSCYVTLERIYVDHFVDVWFESANRREFNSIHPQQPDSTALP